MTIRDILVHIDRSREWDAHIWLASHLARRFSAYVIAAGPEDSAEMEESFVAMLSRDGVQGEWRWITGPAAPYMLRLSRAVDLVILGQPGSEQSSDLANPDDVILGCGQPVLVMPRAGHFDRVGEKFLVGWNGSREATRALHDALPLMEGAKMVTLLSVLPDAQHDEELAGDLVQHLARHEIKTTAEAIGRSSVSVADMIMSRADELHCDLIVMGAYGHSRLREMILGGTTREMLQRANLPVLMSH